MRKISPVVPSIIAASLVLPTLHAQTSAPSSYHPLAPQQVAAYRKIADRIWSRVEALSEQYPHLRTIRTATRRTEPSGRLSISYHYSQGVSTAPNPDYKPEKKSAPTIKVFTPDDGIELNLYFFEGPWLGQAAVLPLVIGDMKVVSFIEGRETPESQSLRSAILRIIRDEQERFDKENARQHR